MVLENHGKWLLSENSVYAKGVNPCLWPPTGL